MQQWLGLDAGIKQQIKQSLLSTLGAQVGARLCRLQQGSWVCYCVSGLPWRLHPVQCIAPPSPG